MGEKSPLNEAVRISISMSYVKVMDCYSEITDKISHQKFSPTLGSVKAPAAKFLRLEAKVQRIYKCLTSIEQPSTVSGYNEKKVTKTHLCSQMEKK